MLLNRNEIREDKYFDMLTEAILERDQPRTTDLFFRMTRDGHSVGDALSVVTAAEAPFVQVPSHINMRDGQITLINNDHTILGLRASAYLMPYLPEKYRLPIVLCELEGRTLEEAAQILGWPRGTVADTLSTPPGPP